MNLADLSRPRVLTWHVHGSYLYYLAHTPCLFILPVKEGRGEGYGGRGGNFAWPENVVEVPAEEIPDTDFDVILFQSKRNYLRDQFNILTPGQRRLPRIFLEEIPPYSMGISTLLPVRLSMIVKLSATPTPLPPSGCDHGKHENGRAKQHHFRELLRFLQIFVVIVAPGH